MSASAVAAPIRSPGFRFKQGFVLASGAYILVSMARIHEIFPQLAPLRLGLLSGVVAIVMAFTTLRGDILTAILASPITRALLVVAAFAVITVPTAAWPTASFNYLTGVYYNAVLGFVLAAAIFADKRASRLVILGIVGSVALGGLAAVLYSEGGRYEIGVTYDANETASLFLMAVPWAIYIVLTEKGWLRLIGIVAIPVFAMGLLKTGSRGGILGAVALVPFLIALAPPNKRGPFIMFVILGAIGTGVSMSDQAVYRLRKSFDTTEYNYTTEDGRVEIWKRGLGYVKSSPLFGAGIDGFQYRELESKQNKAYGIRQAAAHNMYLQVAAELGLIGFGGFMAMLIGGQRLCILARRRARQALQRGGGPEASRDLLQSNMAQASLFSLMCTGFFLSLGYSSMVYIACGICAGTYIASTRGGLPGGLRPNPAAGTRRVRAWRTARSWAAAGIPGTSTPQR